MEHYNVLCAVQVQEVRKQTSFIWAFYQVDGRPQEGTHFLGLDWSYDPLMRVSKHGVLVLVLHVTV